MNKILKVNNLNVAIDEKQILKNINFSVDEGEILGIVGESGSGKTTLLNVLNSLLNTEFFSVDGNISYMDKEDFLALSSKERREFCSKNASMILQDSINSLNPYEKIYFQLFETYKKHNPAINDKKIIDEKIKEILNRIGLKNIEKILHSYPNELSGGMKQRVSIALTLCCSKAKVLYADEPTTSLDVINQFKFVDLIKEICLEKNLTLIYVSHDIKLLLKFCDRIINLKDGEIVEDATSYDIWNKPQHEYTKSIINILKNFD